MRDADAPNSSATVGTAAPGAPDALPLAAWRLLPELPLAELDAGKPDLTRLQLQLLSNRDIHGAQQARAFLGAPWTCAAPAPRGLAEAVDLLLAARRDRLPVTVYGDFDVDGVTSCAVMTLGLRAAGIAATTHIPEREADGRGLNLADVEALAAGGTRLIVTTDCGISNVAEVVRAQELGMRVIVTDHHPPHGEIAPADDIVNPRHPECGSPEKNLAGVGVAFRVVEALLRDVLADSADAALDELLDLVAVGTIGDVVPLTPENWALVHSGLRRLGEQPRPGLRALMRVAGLTPATLTERDVSYILAPRLNAASRMGQPRRALELLLEDDPRRAAELAQQVQALNAQRQELSERIQAEARRQVAGEARQGRGAGTTLLVAQGEGWPLGIIGLVAGRLAEDYGQAAVAISLQGEECRGSMRGPAKCNLVQALARHADLLIRFGGHAQAAGFTTRRADLPALLIALQADLRAAPQPADVAAAGPEGAHEVAHEVAADQSREIAVLAGEPATAVADSARQALVVDLRLPLRSVGREAYEAMRRLAPFGPGFRQPLFLAQGVRVVRCWRSGVGGRTLRLVLRDGPHERLALWSRQGESWQQVRALDRVDVVYRLELLTRPDGEPDYVLWVEALHQASGDAPAYPPT